ncbi:MAG: two component transcriptional regulator, winged helix family [Rubritepida sp.]|nr:two component transcriptional regulator, winged helix family [Rubritepida sp.]
MANQCTPTETAILVIDDDVPFAVELADALTQYDLPTEIAHDWETAIKAVEHFRPKLIILDQRLGRVDALSRLTQLRAVTQVPILLLTGNQCEADRIIGLEIGADDFLQKPISTRELLARIRAHLRRGSLVEKVEPRWRIVPQERRLYRPDGTPVALTATEYEMLSCLSEAVGHPISRDALSSRVLMRPYRAEDRSIDNLIYQLRLKIRDAGGGDVILAARSRGYYFTGFPQR